MMPSLVVDLPQSHIHSRTDIYNPSNCPNCTQKAVTTSPYSVLQEVVIVLYDFHDLTSRLSYPKSRRTPSLQFEYILMQSSCQPLSAWQVTRHAAKRRAVGGEGLANFALDHVFLECQLHVTCEPVVCQFELRTSSVPREASRQDEFSSSLTFQTLSQG